MDTPLFQNHSISGKVIDFFEKSAVIEFENGQKVAWPIINLPEECGLGSAVRLELTLAEGDSLAKERIAKAFINELLATE